MDDNPAIRFFVISTLFIVLEAAVIFMFARKSNEDAARGKEAKWDYAVENGFTFYLDGREVDPGTVSMKQYDVKFDEEAKKVFLTGYLTTARGSIKIKYKTQNANSGQYSALLILGKPAGSDAFIQRNIIIDAMARSEQIIFIKSEAN